MRLLKKLARVSELVHDGIRHWLHSECSRQCVEGSSAILALSATVVSYYVEVVLSDSESLSRKSSTGTTRLVSTTVALRAKIALDSNSILLN